MLSHDRQPDDDDGWRRQSGDLNLKFAGCDKQNVNINLISSILILRYVKSELADQKRKILIVVAWVGAIGHKKPLRKKS